MFSSFDCRDDEELRWTAGSSKSLRLWSGQNWYKCSFSKGLLTDFFNPFEGVRPEVISRYRRSSEEDLRAVREEEGEREVEQENNVVVVEEKRGVENGNGGEVVKMVEEANVSPAETKGLSVIDTPVEGRELLEALKDIVDLFLRE